MILASSKAMPGFLVNLARKRIPCVLQARPLQAVRQQRHVSSAPPDHPRKRSPPEMKLSQGSWKPESLLSLSPEERARRRFRVSGNAIVTGGSGGLGFEAVKALLEHGCGGIAILDLPTKLPETLFEELHKDFPTAKLIFEGVDVTDAAAVTGAVASVETQLGPITKMLCLAGVANHVHSADVSPEEFQRVMKINTDGSFFCAQAFARAAKVHGQGGSITFIGSIAAHRVLFPQPQTAYNISKAAIVHLTRCLAAEWAVDGIRVNSISPGYMGTPMIEGEGLAEMRKVWESRTPMGRVGIPSEIAGPIILLNSDAGSYITGADLLVDGEIIQMGSAQPRTDNRAGGYATL